MFYFGSSCFLLALHFLRLDPGSNLGRVPATVGLQGKVKELCPFGEFWAGVGEIARGDGFAFEFRRDSRMNVHTQEGQEIFLTGLAQVRPLGVAWLSPTCSSWLSFVSKATSKRCKDSPWLPIVISICLREKNNHCTIYYWSIVSLQCWAVALGTILPIWVWSLVVIASMTISDFQNVWASCHGGDSKPLDLESLGTMDRNILHESYIIHSRSEQCCCMSMHQYASYL